jgi:hypothetical protein
MTERDLIATPLRLRIFFIEMFVIAEELWCISSYSFRLLFALNDINIEFCY